MNGNHLASSTVVVVNALRKVSTLKDLTLNDNRNRSKELALGLTMHNKLIKRLLLRDNGLNDDGIIKIAQSLCKCSSLKAFNVQSNI